ncbi:endonuclease [Latilactobacillus curvatus]|uniref:endonuclease n=4 Tax=Latilactobacillus curvatus TaxID=28038 RepID=UPI0020A46D87|nr:endonuclease [Latilactobacillus curvatus]UTC12457.1 hypothetical protein A4W75_05030 [Latilactobacillus curvatus]
MSRLVIKSIVIVDHLNKLANKFNFSEKSNIITSQENEVGKSSLLKSIYYTLGAQIKTFPNGWKYKNYIFQLTCKIDEREMIIQRYNKVFLVKENKDIKSFASEKDFSKWFQKAMEMQMRLTTKNSNKLSLAYNGAILTPFYVDQDKSWSSFYKEAIDGVAMYKSHPKSIFEYYFNISSRAIQDLEEEKNKFEIKKTEIHNQIQQLTGVYESYSTTKDISSGGPEELENLQVELSNYVEITNELRQHISKISKKISYSKEKLDIYYHDLDELKKLLSMTKKRYKEVEFECTYCHSILTREQSLMRLELSDNEFEVRQRKSELEQKIRDENKKFDELINSIDELKADFDEKNRKIANLKNAEGINDYVNQKVLMELQGLLSKYELEKSYIENKLKETMKQIKVERALLKARRNELDKEYEFLKNDLSVQLGDSSLVDKKFLDFSKINETGTAMNKALLILYLTYSKLISKYSDFQFPISIDSFIKNEISDTNEEKMFLSVQRNFISLDSQTFFSVIEKNLKYFDDKNSNVITLMKPILTNGMFDQLISELIREPD